MADLREGIYKTYLALSTSIKIGFPLAMIALIFYESEAPDSFPIYSY